VTMFEMTKHLSRNCSRGVVAARHGTGSMATDLSSRMG
jgi:hypothetical protein